VKVVAQRYVRALADVAVERGTGDQLKKELAAFVDLLDESADLRNFLASPAVVRGHKHGVIKKLTQRMDASETLRNFLLVVVDGRRTGMLRQMYEAFEAELLARMNTAEAYVTSAHELNAAEQAEITKALERRTGRRVQAHYGIDPELIGGAVARVGSTIYDGSLRARLNRLRDRLTAE